MHSIPLTADRRAVYETGQSFPEFLASVTANASLWQALGRRATVPDHQRARARNVPGKWHLLVLLEDWCGDAVTLYPSSPDSWSSHRTSPCGC